MFSLHEREKAVHQAIGAAALALIALAAPPGVRADPSPVAVLTGLEEPVTVDRGEDSRQAAPGMSLYENDQVVTGKGGAAYLLFADNEAVVVEESTRYVVGALRGVRRHSFSGEEVDGEGMEDFRALLVELNYGFGPGEGGERLLYPRQRIVDTRPAFHWLAPGRWDLVLKDDGGREIFRVREVDSPFPYPPEAPSLKTGETYRWQVRKRTTGGGTEARSLAFKVAEAALLARVQRELGEVLKPDFPETHGLYLRGRLLTRLGLYPDAVLVYLRYRALHPRGEHPNRELAKCYERAGLPQLARDLLREYLQDSKSH